MRESAIRYEKFLMPLRSIPNTILLPSTYKPLTGALATRLVGVPPLNSE